MTSVIDRAKGNIVLETLVIGPSLTLESFSASSLSMRVLSLHRFGQWRNFDIGEQKLGERWFAMTLRFDGERLAMVELSATDPDAAHAAWLFEHLGPPPYAWGRIESVHDPRRLSSNIVLTYAST